MTLAWMNEAAYTINDSQRTDLAEVDLADPSARDSYMQAREAASRNSGGDEIPRLPAKGLLPVTPDETWFRVLDPDMARQARRLAGRIAAEAGDRQRCFAVIRSLVAGEPKIAKELAEQYLLAWSGRLQGGSDSDVPDSYGGAMEGIEGAISPIRPIGPISPTLPIRRTAAMPAPAASRCCATSRSRTWPSLPSCSRPSRH